jgi:sugar lactone lactonase YvrE
MTTTYTATTLREGLIFGEAPRWHDERLWYSDFYRHGVFSIDPAGHEERRELTVATQPSGLGWLPDGSMLVVSMIDNKVLRVVNGVTSEYCDVSAHAGFWSNDMTVSSSGVAYVGDFGFDLDVFLREKGVEGLLADPPPATSVAVIAEGGTIIQWVDDMHFPNGTVITPDAKTLIIAETMSFRLTAFDIGADGTLSNRRLFAQLDFVPADGICLDAEGQVWVAHPTSAEVLRVRDGGEITARVATSQHTFACMLGGEDRSTLFIMTAGSSDRFVIADQAAPLGKIEVATVAVPGAGLP